MELQKKEITDMLDNIFMYGYGGCFIFSTNEFIWDNINFENYKEKVEKVDFHNYYDGDRRFFELYKVINTDKLIVLRLDNFEDDYIGLYFTIENGIVKDCEIDLDFDDSEESGINIFNFHTLSRVVYDKEFDKYFRPWFMSKFEDLTIIQTFQIFEYYPSDFKLYVKKVDNIYHFSIF